MKKYLTKIEDKIAREIQIAEMRQTMTLAEIGKKVNLNKERVRQILLNYYNRISNL
jgi:DNA-directed RNA polymerase sigma subunit (sigma70/sigma32)